MIIIDMNQVMISNLMAQIKRDVLDEKLVRHMVLTSLRSYEKQYIDEYGEVVLKLMTVDITGVRMSFLTTNKIVKKIEKNLDTTGVKSLRF